MTRSPNSARVSESSVSPSDTATPWVGGASSKMSWPWWLPCIAGDQRARIVATSSASSQLAAQIASATGPGRSPPLRPWRSRRACRQRRKCDADTAVGRWAKATGDPLGCMPSAGTARAYCKALPRERHGIRQASFKPEAAVALGERGPAGDRAGTLTERGPDGSAASPAGAFRGAGPAASKASTSPSCQTKRKEVSAGPGRHRFADAPHCRGGAHGVGGVAALPQHA